jgi:hypothetical protein
MKSMGPSHRVKLTQLNSTFSDRLTFITLPMFMVVGMLPCRTHNTLAKCVDRRINLFPSNTHNIYIYIYQYINLTISWLNIDLT